MTDSAPLAALVVAAGRGTRLGGPVPKQYRHVAGRPVLTHTLEHLLRPALFDRVLVVIHPDDSAAFAGAVALLGAAGARIDFCPGGSSRQDSVRLGLEALAQAGLPDPAIVLIHDAARPFSSEAVLMRAVLAAQRTGAAIPVLQVPDTLAVLDEAGYLAGNPDRNKVRLVQTPQAFRFGPVLAAHRRALAEGRTDFTDDAGLAVAYGQGVGSFAGDEALFKITREEDLARAERHLAPQAETRTGLGYDVHAFTEGDHVWLGGVAIPHGRKLLGHSDADPLLHALTDALLGTIGDGDIGQHFPPSDPRWKGAPSRLFLADAARRVAERGGRIVSVDCTVLAEAPKVGPHRAAMQALIGEVLGLAPERVGIKATTSEKLGFVGRSEGIAAMAVANVMFGGG
ncbi:bifunctional 2-C-methyl-D-erythritol 4-phosphate cytidylyltransferase/2-C-methyl-D-erythritol 2,4-cyclodiphosphate synthase [Rhabdaerophilum sp. SD176]|uniref:bifunctional 2-C-methyl-D-erythritol 4-phosphate cytidylyltransferase/2-C-methyl-D-erythritol 2,4-cyclodiphosphate synthase n=1 Tax=Rhabdaerophilum sp. SD176 TaxID=2983548 RepID=UPI0024DFF12E|nr:bifunctional 2-C-methyl-D-erythritol 4-phosphate cytidylyltransferase/2-C-methyl-D-erythritol 2,4-cyclodiphosphate synthase [Rhabdaerophilum sp. SD176]